MYADNRRTIAAPGCCCTTNLHKNKKIKTQINRSVLSSTQLGSPAPTHCQMFQHIIMLTSPLSCVLHTSQVYSPACATSIYTYPRAAHNSFRQVRRLVYSVLSQPIDAGRLNKLKPSLSFLREMHRLCSLARMSRIPHYEFSIY